MSVELEALKRIAVYEEPNGSFAVDGSATPANFLDVPIMEGSASWSAGRQFQQKNTLQQYSYQFDSVVQGWKRPTLKFKMHLAPNGTAANSSTASLSSSVVAVQRILKAVMGGEGAGSQGSAVSGAPTSAAVFAVTAGHGSRFTNKQAVGLVDTNNVCEVRELVSKATDTLTLYHRGSFTPANGSAVYNSASYYITDSPDTSLQFIVEGKEQDDRWVLQGMQCTSFAIDLPNDGFPTVEMEFTGVYFAALSSAAITGATYSNFDPQWKAHKTFTAPYSAAGDQTATSQCTQARMFDPKIAFEPLFCPSATYGVERYYKKRTEPVQAKITLPYQDTSWFTAADAGTEYYLSQQYGSAAGKTVTVVIRRAIAIDVNRVGDTFAQQEVTFQAGHVTNSSTDLSRTPIAIHFV